MGRCEIMAKMVQVRRCSMLKSNGVRLNGQLQSCRWCGLCDTSMSVEDVVHCILQCPSSQDIRVEIFQAIDIVCTPI